MGSGELFKYVLVRRDEIGIKECLGMINHTFGGGKMGAWEWKGKR